MKTETIVVIDNENIEEETLNLDIIIIFPLSAQ